MLAFKPYDFLVLICCLCVGCGINASSLPKEEAKLAGRDLAQEGDNAEQGVYRRAIQIRTVGVEIGFELRWQRFNAAILPSVFSDGRFPPLLSTNIVRGIRVFRSTFSPNEDFEDQDRKEYTIYESRKNTFLWGEEGRYYYGIFDGITQQHAAFYDTAPPPPWKIVLFNYDKWLFVSNSWPIEALPVVSQFLYAHLALLETPWWPSQADYYLN